MKPRILVSAPSNTAVDNIVLRIMEQGFLDGDGQRYGDDYGGGGRFGREYDEDEEDYEDEEDEDEDDLFD